MSTTGQLSTTWRYPSVIRGYHVYKDIWVAVEDEMLDCINIRGISVILEKREN